MPKSENFFQQRGQIPILNCAKPPRSRRNGMVELGSRLRMVLAIAGVSVLVALLGGYALYFGTGAAPAGPPDTIPPEITAASNNFAMDLYRQISDDDGNVFFSPLSVYVALSVVGEGAKGETASQIQDAFGFEPDAQTRHRQTAGLMSSLNWPDPHATLTMANSLWLAEWFEPYDSYVGIIQDVYQADIGSVDFLGDGVDQINEWAAEKTQGKIQDVLKRDAVDGLTAAVVLNAIYFKGMWAEQFQMGDTREADFWTGMTVVKADFMSIEKRFDYAQSDGVQILKMPYRGDRLSMLVMLPQDRDGIDHLEETVTPEQIGRWRQSLNDADLVVVMPKFEVRTHYELTPHLGSLGVTHLFDRHAADLSGMADLERNLHVDQITQDAYIQVNEEGTEAAAVTTAKLQSRLQFVADHPFMFLIQDDKSGTILFMGRVSDPS